VSTVLRLAVAALAGLAAAAAFEPLAWAVLLVPAVAALSVAVRGAGGRLAFGTGMVFGLAFMAALLPWIQVIGVDAWIGLSVLEAAFFGVLGAALAAVARLPWWPVWASACWVAVEALRSVVPWGGFPWGRLAFASIDTPLAPAMGIVGTAGTTFLIALLGTSLAWLLLGGHRGAATTVAVVVGVVAVAATPALVAAALPEPDSGRSVRVAAVQGNVPGEGMDAFSERRAVLDNHVGATLDLAERVDSGDSERPEFVLWPENSTDIDPFGDPTVRADIQDAVDAVAVPVLVGAMVDGDEPGDVRNEGIVWGPTGTADAGPGERYAKTHPVPFGEYIPMRDQLAKLFERLDQIPRDMVPGTEPGVLDLAGTTVGDVICFEVAYDGLVHDVVDGGAEMLVVQTNNATYMGTGQVEQQFAIARLRAVETSRYVVVVATNGVSGVIAPDGSVVERAPVRGTAVLEQEVPLRTVTTPGVRVGRWIELALVVVALAAVVAAAVTGRRTPAAVAERPATGRVGADA
jgi:apolipoprotein N-acyltransferase